MSWSVNQLPNLWPDSIFVASKSVRCEKCQVPSVQIQIPARCAGRVSCVKGSPGVVLVSVCQLLNFCIGDMLPNQWGGLCSFFKEVEL